MDDLDYNDQPFVTEVLPLETKAQATRLDTTGVRPANIEYALLPITELEESFRHSGWRANRQKVLNALLAVNKSAARIDAFCNCGSAMMVEASEAGDELRILGSYCHDRFCVACGNERSERIARNVAKKVEGHVIRFVTFTVKHTTKPLYNQLRKLFADFRLIRRVEPWKSMVSGGAYFCEIKLSEADGMWHPHLHCLVEGGFIDQQQLRDAWLRITGDSFVVDVRAVSDQESVVRYVSKYVGKPVDASVYKDPERLAEYILAVGGTRFCGGFGDWRGFRLEARSTTDVVWKKLGMLTTLLDDARSGDQAALELITALRRKYFWLPSAADLKEKPP
jgi:hypothetical protein